MLEVWTRILSLLKHSTPASFPRPFEEWKILLPSNCRGKRPAWANLAWECPIPLQEFSPENDPSENLAVSSLENEHEFIIKIDQKHKVHKEEIKC